jgi:hypothetical protein
MKPRLFLSGFALVLFAFASIGYSQNRFQHPEAHFSFDLPEEWERIPADVVQEYHNEMLKKTGATAKVPDAAFKKKSARSPFELPYFLVNLFEQDMDDSVIQGYLSSMQSLPRREPSQQGQSAEGSMTEPVFDEKRKMITLSIDSIVGTGEQETEITGYFAIFFFKDGVVTCNFYAKRNQFSEHKPVFEKMITSAAFDRGYEYKPPLFKNTLARNSVIVVAILVALGLLFWFVRVKRRGPVAKKPEK